METLYAMFDEASLALRAVATLMERGVRTADISVISKSGLNGAAKDATRIAVGNSEVSNDEKIDEKREEIRDRSGANNTCLDVVKGAGIGLGVGLTAALAAITIPGFGIVAGGGALATAIAGAASATAAGAVAGGALNYFRDAGISNEALENLLRAYERGWAIVAVEIPDGVLDVASAKQVFAQYHASNINTLNGALSLAR